MANQAKCPRCKVRYVWHVGYVSDEDLKVGRCPPADWDKIRNMTQSYTATRGARAGSTVLKGKDFPLNGRYVCPRCRGPLAATSHLSKLPIVAELPEKEGWS